ncbi:hypothetical protein [Aeromicrobium sp.]|uniref:hypothetical protein n=1 Tax=Aeromicrobium sp. TaxID=1871063 RepID=UPI00199F7D70|nr:hypothetical protein [Aeromicrobium sp.]MBC7633919.1 hypothetical protein [Aeromicrobium sp.]
MTAAGLDVDALAVEMSAQGFGEFVDFYIANRADGTLPSSEHIGLRSDDGRYDIWYRDMGVSRQLLTTTDPEEARRMFIDETRKLVAVRRPGSTSGTTS